MSAQLVAELARKVDAPTLAAAALRRSPLSEYYAADFTCRLAEMKGGGKKRTVVAWIERAEAKAGFKLTTADEIYLGLALVSPVFAQEFAVENPGSAAFERICVAFTDRIGPAGKEAWEEFAASLPTPRDRLKFPILAKALKVGGAEFASFCIVNCYRRPQFAPNPAEKESYRRFCLPIRNAFESKHGTILEEFWGGNVALGVARTSGGTSGMRVHFDGDYDPCLAEIFNRCKEINRNGRRFLPSTEYKTLAGNLYDFFAELISAVDDAAQDAEGPEAKKAAASKVDLKPFLCRVQVFEKELNAGSARKGQRIYVLGTGVGLIFVAAAFAVAALHASGNWTKIFEGAIFGAAGALASVLFRIGRGKLKVDAQQGRLLILLSALVKPLTGAIFGGILVALLLSGLPQIEVPTDEPKRFFFLAVLAFIAGFSERFAPSLLQFTEDRVKTEAAAKPEEAGEAGPKEAAPAATPSAA